MDQPSTARPVRWGWAAVILLLAGAALVAVRTLAVSRQHQVLHSTMVVIISGLLLSIWALFFSRFAGRTRLAIFFAGVALIGGSIGSFKVTGVTGDLVPIVEFRWSKAPSIETPVAAKPLSGASVAVSFPQFLGPNRNGIISGTRLETNWSAHPPRELWRHAVGAAWTGFAIEGGVAITQEQRANQELVTCYDLLTGNLLWSHADPVRYFTTLGGEGPRAAPTIHGRRVFTLGATGILNCLDRDTGKVFWSKDLVLEHHAKIPEWGFASAPLVHNGAVIVNAGGKPDRSLVAHDAETGKFLWGSGDDSAGYSSPTLLTLAGAPQIILFNHKQVEARDPVKGSMLWTYPWTPSHPHVAMPILVSTNQLLVSSGYGYGSELLEVTAAEGWKAERVWKSNRLKSKFANLILHDGFVYGLDDGILACLDPKTGERRWHGTRLGHGQLLLVEGILLLTAENGEILLVEPSPQEERILSRFRAFKDKTWNPPALAGPYLIVRNHIEAACYQLTVAAR